MHQLIKIINQLMVLGGHRGIRLCSKLYGNEIDKNEIKLSNEDSCIKFITFEIDIKCCTPGCLK